jgi:predicted nucleotidyltransferase
MEQKTGQHEMKSIKELLKGYEYEFLRTNEHLKGRLIFVTYGGSHAYGTDTPDSDIDIRGCAFDRKSDLIGMSSFEQVIDHETDTTIYGFRKLVKLLMNANPNTIEMLGCKAEHYVMFSPVGQELIANSKMFLSRRAADSFGGYASQQLRRLQNAVARDALSQSEKEIHILASVNNAMISFNERYADFENGAIKLYIDKSNKDGMETEIHMDVDLEKYPLRDYKSLWSEMHSIVKLYDNLNNRNNKKDDIHLNKHAMHLIRLYLMAIDIFEKEEIITYRENDLDLLRSIRNGKYMNDDGTYQKEFFELLSEYEKRLEYAVENTGLPEKPDGKYIEEFVMSVNERVIADEY